MKKSNTKIMIHIFILSFVFFALFNFSGHLYKSATTPVIDVENKQASPGELVNVNIRLKDNPGIIALKLKINYNSDHLELVNAKDGGILDNFTKSKNYSDKPYIVLWNSGGYENITQSGVILTLQFRVLEDTWEGYSPITLTYDQNDCYDIDFDNVYFKVSSGGITIVNETISPSPAKTPGSTVTASPSASAPVNTPTPVLPDNTSTPTVGPTPENTADNSPTPEYTPTPLNPLDMLINDKGNISIKGLQGYTFGEGFTLHGEDITKKLTSSQIKNYRKIIELFDEEKHFTAGYEIYLKYDQAYAAVAGSVEVRIDYKNMFDDLAVQDITVIYCSDTEHYVVEHRIEGDDIVFVTNKLGNFILASEQEADKDSGGLSGWSLLLVLAIAGAAGIFAAFGLSGIGRKRESEKEKND